MKKFFKLISAILITVMMLSFSVTLYADDSLTGLVVNITGPSYMKIEEGDIIRFDLYLEFDDEHKTLDIPVKMGESVVTFDNGGYIVEGASYISNGEVSEDYVLHVPEIIEIPPNTLRPLAIGVDYYGEEVDYMAPPAEESSQVEEVESSSEVAIKEESSESEEAITEAVHVEEETNETVEDDKTNTSINKQRIILTVIFASIGIVILLIYLFKKYKK